MRRVHVTRVMRGRFYCLVPIALAATFALGWMGGARTAMSGGRHVVLAATDTAAPAAATTGPASCIDTAAMEANANLVGQVHDYRTRLSATEERARQAEKTITGAANAPHPLLVRPREDWARMSQSRSIELRLPCTHWNAPGTMVVHRRHGDSVGGRVNASRSLQARSSGLRDQELEAVSEAYQRAVARTWKEMRPICESSDVVRELLDLEEEGHDRQQIYRCEHGLLSLTNESTRTAIPRVSALRTASSAVPPRAGGSLEEQLLIVLSQASVTLYDELTRTLGRDRAHRLLDSGAVCLDTIVFQTQEDEEDS